MKKIKKTKQALVVWLSVRYLRVRGRVLGVYVSRVCEPVRIWVAFGSPADMVPRLPWWQPFMYSFINTIGWSKHLPRRKMSQEEWNQERIARYEERFARKQYSFHM